ncbi:MAG: hypothetical protein AB8F78_05000 [Saprospiraceae bacterium]
MARSSKHILPPSLERQLERIELVGNAEAELLAKEENDFLEVAPKKSSSKLSISERQHRIDTARELFLRETKRTKKFGIVLLALVPLTCLTYFASIMTENSMLALASMLLTGLLIGFGVVVIYMSKRNISALTAASDD